MDLDVYIYTPNQCIHKDTRHTVNLLCHHESLKASGNHYSYAIYALPPKNVQFNLIAKGFVTTKRTKLKKMLRPTPTWS